MLHYETIHPTTLELLKKLTAQEEFRELRLVGGTSSVDSERREG